MVDNKGSLKDVFTKFAGGKEMDGKTFAKVAKDTGILDKKLTATDVDLIFAKVKTSSAVRTITYDQFEKGVQQWAEKKGVTAEDLKQKLVSTGGPQFTGTKADNVKFHDDPNQYTGTHQGKATGTGSTQASTAQKEEHKEVKQAPKQVAQQAQKAQSASSLQEVFLGFTGGQHEMDGKTFAKLSKDTNILDKKLTPTDIDLIFAKVKDKAARKITYGQFEAAIAECAKKKGVTTQELSAAIIATGGPVFTATKADNVKFHDDKSLYTGVYAQGGPSTKDGGIKDLSQLADRSAADVRGIKK